jgi:hypothetical protein
MLRSSSRVAEEIDPEFLRQVEECANTVARKNLELGVVALRLLIRGSRGEERKLISQLGVNLASLTRAGRDSIHILRSGAIVVLAPGNGLDATIRFAERLRRRAVWDLDLLTIRRTTPGLQILVGTCVTAVGFSNPLASLSAARRNLGRADARSARWSGPGRSSERP